MLQVLPKEVIRSGTSDGQEGELEETVRKIRVETSETLVRKFACEEMNVVEEYRAGMQQRVRWADVEEGRPQRELSQNEQWDEVESTGTEGDESIGSAREAFEPRETNSTGGKIKKNKTD